MAAKTAGLAACCVFHLAVCVNLNGFARHPSSKPPAALTSMKKAIAASDSDSYSDMKEVFVRSTEVHDDSMTRIAATIQTVSQAMEALENSSDFGNSSELKEVTTLLAAKKSLRVDKQNPAGGIASAKKLLNEMIYEAMAKYDQEIQKCTAYYTHQCILMEGCRSSISASNYVAANSRALILDAQGNINKCEKSIPERKMELKTHTTKCSTELKKMNENLKIVMGDIAVMTMILKMTDCETKLMQLEKVAMLRCRNDCKNGRYMVFNDTKLQKQVSALQSSAAKVLLSDTLSDMFDDADPEEMVDFVQVDGTFSSFFQAKTTTPAPDAGNKTAFNNPPVPRTKVPGNPCSDPNFGAPSAEDKRAAKCTIKKSPQCYKLQSRFLMIQGGIQDERDQLMEDVEKLDESCKETKRTLEASIASDEDLLSSSQTKLAQATEKEANAGEKARQTTKEHEELNKDLKTQMTKCSEHYVETETEMCALKKIRGELFKMKGGKDASGFFQDCEVSKWTPEECTKECEGGEQKLTRSVLTHPNGGAKCLPLSADTSCNTGPCPIDCVLGMWSGWSKCSADCGGGVTQRLREVKTAPRYDGKPCSAASESKSCNIAACEKDCVLSEWTAWTDCSKDCDGGTMKRQRFISKAAEGSGKCAGQWDPDRLQYQPCNMKRCHAGLKCTKTADYILMMDACPKSGKDGWAAEVKAAKGFIDSLKGGGKPQVAILHYCGPRTWSGVSKCTAKNEGKVDLEKVCKIKIAQHFETNLEKVKKVIAGLEYMQGEKLLSLALMAAKAELALGDKASPSNVLVFIDGMPLSLRQTLQAATVVRKAARLHYIVTSKFSPLKYIKTWATRRWEENIVTVDTPEKLSQPSVVTHVVANLCPSEKPKTKFRRHK